MLMADSRDKWSKVALMTESRDRRSRVVLMADSKGRWINSRVVDVR